MRRPDPRPILVAGKNGQLARCLVEAAAARGTRLVALGRPQLDLEHADDIARIVATLDPAAIVNAAAYTAVDQAESEPARAFAINCDGAARLAEVAAKRGIPFLHVSTDYVFDGGKRTPYREDDATGPLGIYGRSKLAGEAAVRDAHPAAIVVRTSWVYSPYGTNFLRTMLRLAETGRALRVVDDQRGAPTSAAHLAPPILAMLAQARAGGGAGGLYHLTAQGSTTWYGFAAAIFTALARRGRPVPGLTAITTAQYPTPARRPAYSCLDSSNAARVFGVRLARWQDALDECLDTMNQRTELTPC